MATVFGVRMCSRREPDGAGVAGHPSITTQTASHDKPGFADIAVILRVPARVPVPTRNQARAGAVLPLESALPAWARRRLFHTCRGGPPPWAPLGRGVAGLLVRERCPVIQPASVHRRRQGACDQCMDVWPHLGQGSLPLELPHAVRHRLLGQSCGMPETLPHSPFA